MDSAYTIDPKTRSEVDGWVDVPFAPSQLREAGELRFAPPFHPLLPFARHMAVLKGVELHTANHVTGQLQFVRMKTGVSRSMPSILDILGSTRDGQPLSSVTLGMLTSEDFTSEWFGSSTLPEGMLGGGVARAFEELESATSIDLDAMAAVLTEQAEGLRTTGALHLQRQRAFQARRMEDVAQLYRRLKSIPPMPHDDWAPAPNIPEGVLAFRRAIWLLENDVSGGVLIRLRRTPDWDSHTYNAHAQATLNADLAGLLARFLGELGNRRNAHGPLLEQTVLVVGSEIGRFPRLNSDFGKDHFPEAPFLLAGAGINSGGGRGAVFGETGRSMEAISCSPSTGKPVNGGGPFQLDDLGATLLDLAAIDPRKHGYSGRVLKFLEAA
ncbi:MAG: DUF1501 domain-containing protein [Archangiaceae bacterium]|nr:DUF1501 domain-containing protein [Archangiaceae bacterium]